MATEGTPNSQASGAGAAPPPPTSPMAGALALVAASAIGSLVGSRIGIRPLAVAVGATALAWLNRKKAPLDSPPPPSVASEPPPVVVPVETPEWAPAAAPAPQHGMPPVSVPAWAPTVAAVPVPHPVTAAISPTAIAPVPVPPHQPVFAETLPAAPVFAPAAPATFAFLSAPTNPAEDPRIQAWLARQMDREERAAAQENISLSTEDENFSAAAGAPWLQPEPEPAEPAPVPHNLFLESIQEETVLAEAEDDYHPEPLVADAPVDHAAWQPHSFAGLTEPRPVPAPAPAWASLPTSKPTLPVEEAVQQPSMAVGVPESAAMPSIVPQTPPSLRPSVVPEEAARPVFSSSFKPQSHPLPAHRPPTAPLAVPFIAASAIPGIEPLPSWNEVVERHPQPQVPPSPVSFPSAATAAPVPDVSDTPVSVGVNLESLFDTPVFQDTPLPHEIHVTEQAAAVSAVSAKAPLFIAAPNTVSTRPVLQQVESPGSKTTAATPEPAPSSAPWHAAANTPMFAEAPPVLTSPSPWAPPSTTPPPLPTPPVEDPMASFFRAPDPVTADTKTESSLDEAAPAPEIAVHMAAPGEAWFDPPLAGAGVPNPWLPPKGDVEGADVPLTSSFAPLTPSSASPILDAEVVLRPRAPTQTAVVPKNSSFKPAIVDPEDPAPKDAALPSAPVKSPREQRARTTWRSWWKGD